MIQSNTNINSESVISNKLLVVSRKSKLLNSIKSKLRRGRQGSSQVEFLEHKVLRKWRRRLAQKWRWRWNRRSEKAWKRVRLLNKTPLGRVSFIKSKRVFASNRIIKNYVGWRWSLGTTQRDLVLNIKNTKMVYNRLDSYLVLSGFTRNITNTKDLIISGGILLNGRTVENISGLIKEGGIIQFKPSAAHKCLLRRVGVVDSFVVSGLLSKTASLKQRCFLK